MSRVFVKRLAIVWSCALSVIPASVGAEDSVGISPGHQALAQRVEARCPTFSWTATDEAAGYEVAVYEITEKGPQDEPVLRKSIAGKAYSWTPDLSSCLTSGARYAWSVRGLLVSGESSWSEPLLFQVDAGPTPQQFEEALQVVREYLDSGEAVAADVDGESAPAQVLSPVAGSSDDPDKNTVRPSRAQLSEAARPEVARVEVVQPDDETSAAPEGVGTPTTILDSGEVIVGNTELNEVATGKLVFDEDTTNPDLCGFELVYDGVTNNLTLVRACGTTPSAVFSVERDVGTMTVFSEIVFDNTTTMPEGNRLYGNSMPLAYGYIAASGAIFQDYGVASVTPAATGVYEITLDNNWAGSPVVIATAYNATNATEVAVYSFTGSNVVTLRFVNGSSLPTSTSFSFVVFGTAQ